LLWSAAPLVDADDAFFEIDAGLDGSQNFVAGTEDAAEELELHVQQLIDALVCGVAPVEKVHHDHIELLSIAMAPANALLNALWIPRQVVVHDQIAKLEVDSLRSRLGGNHDAGFISEVVNESRTLIRGR
jgi:hypothetical protein